MAKCILVPASGAETDAPVFATALSIARRLQAHLQFLHVRVDVQEAMTALASVDVRRSGIVTGGAGGGIPFAQTREDLEQAVANRQKKAESAFRDFCEHEGVLVTVDPSAALPSAEWLVETGDECSWLADYSRAADLVVVGREGWGEPVATDLLEAALLTTGRPVLIAPPKRRTELSGVVAIAWKNRPEASRAVAAAEPFLHLADRVVILAVGEDAGSDERSCERLRRTLSWHNPHCAVQHLKASNLSPVETLLAAAADVNADMLVMGAYGHNRIRQAIFGGFTRRVLLQADLPVLMAH